MVRAVAVAVKNVRRLSYLVSLFGSLLQVLWAVEVAGSPSSNFLIFHRAGEELIG